MAARVTATPEAVELIGRLRATNGPLAFFQSACCCEGSAPMCLAAGDLPPAAGDVQLGEIGGTPFYIDAEQYERWGRPASSSTSRRRGRGVLARRAHRRALRDAAGTGLEWATAGVGAA